MPTIDINKNTTVSYTIAGSGPAVVLVHGTGATGQTNWGQTIERLKDRFTVIAPDLSGSGGTVDGGGPIELDDLVTQVVGAADAAGAGTFHLAGYSTGAVVAAAIAAARPGRVRSLVLVAGWACSGVRERFQHALWRRLYTTDPELQVRHAFLAGMGPAFFAHATDETLEQGVRGFAQLLPAGFVRQSEFNTRVDIRPLLGRITAPTRVVGLTHDRMFPIEHSRTLADGIDGAEFVELETGHFIPWEAPDLLATSLETFFVAHAAAPAVAR